MHIKNKITIASLLSLWGIPALAHVGHMEHGVNHFVSGLSHPVSGIDHFLAMIAVGLWSAVILQGKRQWLGPLTFVLAMIIGAWIGTQYSVSGTEFMIAGSLAFFGAMLVMLFGHRKTSGHTTALASCLGMGVVAFSALFHGIAHGNEMPMGEAFGMYALGFVLATFSLHILGLVSSRYLLRVQPLVLRFMGFVVGFNGFLLLWQQI